ncbi:hypothetical protein [Williamsia sterculiae]|uniref:Uncharacterized protein n=1 Tax=Williamsia sterculiae TaxID=1344003 RepID=A0A1N7HEH9_9NOCA|nr:hypothetical protein [Williamsia sterculiae]SIS23286.1 hypothetical protein SAMN05445060_4090 [Williamsia sterculiae]
MTTTTLPTTLAGDTIDSTSTHTTTPGAPGLRARLRMVTVLGSAALVTVLAGPVTATAAPGDPTPTPTPGAGTGADVGGGGLPGGIQVTVQTAPGQNKWNWLAGVALGLCILVAIVGLAFGFAKLSHAKKSHNVGSEEGSAIAYSALGLAGLSSLGAIASGIYMGAS